MFDFAVPPKMTNEQKLKECLIPSNEIRVVTHQNGRIDHDHSKIQQKFYNYTRTVFIWRDVKTTKISFDDWNNGYSFN